VSWFLAYSTFIMYEQYVDKISIIAYNVMEAMVVEE